MTIRIIAVLAVAALFGGSVAGSAFGASASSLTTIEEEADPEDEPVVGPVTTHCGSSPEPEWEDSLLEAGSLDADDCAVTHSCRRVDVPKTHRTLLRFVAFRFWHWIRWCWRYPRVLSSTTGEYVTNVDPNWRYGGVVSRYKQNFTWCCGRGDSGVVTFAQARFDNCVAWVGCLGTVYPWVRIRAHGNGTYTSATGT